MLRTGGPDDVPPQSHIRPATTALRRDAPEAAGFLASAAVLTRTEIAPPRVQTRWWVLACGVAALGMAAVTDQPAHRVWGLVAGAGYLLLALTPLAARPAVPWLAGLVGGAAPLLVLVLARGGTSGPSPYAQPEVWVIEDAARRWLATGSPYPATLTGGADGYFPYLPGMALFGMPRALFGDGILTDARVWFALVTALGVLAVIRAGRVPVAGWLVAGNPVVGLTVATGGHDLAMAGLLVAGLAAAARPGPRAAALAGLLVGLAAATKPTAWPVLAVLVVLLARQRRAGPCVAAAAVPLVVLLAPALVTPQRLAEHVLTFPAGLAAVPSPAGSPLPGGWLAALPGGRWVALALLAAAALAVLARLVTRPPPDLAGAAGFAAAALTLATLLAPSTRVGWLVVPALLAGLAVTVRERTGARARDRT